LITVTTSQVLQLRHDLAELANSTTDTAADLDAHLEELADTQSGPDNRAVVVLARPRVQGGGRALVTLTDWVAWLRGRYPLAKKIPVCWAEHPEIVEEVTALWLAWQHAYTDSGAPLTAAADWHDRWLPGFLHRLDHGPLALHRSSEHATRPSSAFA
jgi:hypothetical protein